MVSQGVLKKEYEWKTAHVYLTDKGKKLCEEIDESFEKMYKKYTDILGEDLNNSGMS